VTYRAEQWRAAAVGVTETASATFLLLIAVKYFSAGPTAKAIIASGGSLGLLLTPFTIWLAGRLRWPVSRLAAAMARVGAVCFLIPAVLPSLLAYLVCSTLAMTMILAMIPLLTHMLQENYPGGERGNRFSRTVMIRIVSAAAFSWGAGAFLSGHIARYPWVLAAFAGALAFAGSCLARCPTTPVSREGGTHPFRAFRYIREDRAFRITLVSWMLMGFGNLMMLPLRVEYLANPKYGLALSSGMIAMLTGVIPNVARFFMIGIWGRLFDRMNFFGMRALLNLGFMLGIVAFFTGTSLPWLVAGSIVIGVSNAGGDIAWSLWVTKLAQPSRVADYMVVHTFLNGLRLAVAPFVAFWAIESLTVANLGLISAAFIGAATLVLLPEMNDPLMRRLKALLAGTPTE